MATTIRTYLPDFIYSSELQEIEFKTDESKLHISLEDEGEVLLQTSIYAYDGKATFCNIVDIIENYMNYTDKSYVEYNLTYSDAYNNLLGSITLKTLYCTHIPNTRVSAFAFSNFLTTLPERRIHRYASTYLYLLLSEGEEGVAKAHCTIVNNKGEIESVVVDFYNLSTTKICIKRIPSEYNYICYYLSKICPDFQKVLSYTIEFNDRYCTFYLIDDSLDLMLSFKNCFNVGESFCLTASTTTKIKVNRSMVISKGKSSYYDQTVDKTYEVQTAPLTQAEAEWMEQLFVSHTIGAGLNPDPKDLDKVIITDITYEVCDDGSNMHTIKFEWRYADKHPYLTIPHRFKSHIFTNEYNHSFN